MNSFIGEIRVFSFNRLPNDWLPCNGQQLSAKQYPGLFALLGNTYGGDGETNFRLPDLQGRTMVSFGTYGNNPGIQYEQGKTGGSETVGLTTGQLPSHLHKLHMAQQTGTVSLFFSDAYRAAIPNVPQLTTENIVAFGNPDSIDELTPLNPGSVAQTGVGQPHNNMMPYMPLLVCIATAGDWPPKRN